MFQKKKFPFVLELYVFFYFYNHFSLYFIFSNSMDSIFKNKDEDRGEI